MERVGRDQELSKSALHTHLRKWLLTSRDATVGPDETDGRTPWIYVRDGSRWFVLHADTKRASVKSYLEIVARHGDELRWEIALSQRGKWTVVVFGPERCRPKGFYLYVAGTAG